MEIEQLEAEILQVAARLDAAVDSTQVEDLDRGLALLQKVDAYLKRSGSSEGGHSKRNIVVMGTTGAGKSTVVSFLFGEGQVLVRHESQYSRVLVADQPLPRVHIRSGAVSTTLLPVVNRVDSGDGDVAVWDMPGSHDTRSPFVELLVHYIFKWLLVDDKALTFVIVSPPLHERPQRVALQQLINGSLVRADNSIVVYTKCDADFDPRSTADLDLEEAKRAIRSFALRAPTTTNGEGHSYTFQYQAERREILDALAALRLNGDPVTYTAPLPGAAQRLMEKFRDISIASARSALSSTFFLAFQRGAYRASLTVMVNLLDALKSPAALSFNEMVNLLGQVVGDGTDRIRLALTVEEAARRLDVVEVWTGEEIRRHQAAWLNSECYLTLENVKQQLAGLISRVNAFHHVDNQGDALIISAFHLRLSQCRHRIEKFMNNHLRRGIRSANNIPTVFLVGFGSLEVDETLKMWVNVALVSQSVVVEAKHAFDLSATGQAPSPRIDNYTARKDGEPGAPGLPGGNLLVMCKALQDDDQKLRATRSRGQQGGTGQNGRNGVSGQNSVYGLRNFKDAVKLAIKVGLLSEEQWESDSPALTNGLTVASKKKDQSNCKGGLRGYSADDPEILEPAVAPSPEPSLLEAEPLVGGNRVDAVANPSLGRLWVKEKFQNARDRLERMFPRCDFADLDMQWGGKAEEQEDTGTGSAATA
ncbi:hypothetical protein BBJ28_00021472 [Nothophytophthora sp. Chile5]|nr:hypothetical protein BBJ28_00021472 [Nothophytophthora sp. Chile5]